MQISARNQLWGTVESLSTGAVNTEVHIKTDGGISLSAIVTCEGATALGLEVGKRVCALIKATTPLIMVGDAKVSAQNALKGTISAMNLGPVNGNLTLHIDTTPLVVQITKVSVEKLGLAVGEEVTVIFKANQVLLAVE